MNNLFKSPAAALAMRVLDRSVFHQTILTTAAVVRDNRLLSKYRKDFEKTNELMLLRLFNPIVTHPDTSVGAQGQKCLVLRPDLRASAPETWSSVLKDAHGSGDLSLVPYDLEVGYPFWSYNAVMKAILPEDLQDEIPAGFNTAGHVAHLNLRDRYEPYKSIIAQVILDKNPHLRTVINKVDNVGTNDEFRTFDYEVLAGPDDMLVETTESTCIFEFDYSKVYWNSKLSTEHQRVASLFKPGEAVVDVMAGIGPFAVPAGKQGVFVWANDKNPESWKYLNQAIKRNKVAQFVIPYNDDGHSFIKKATNMVLNASERGDYATVPVKVSRNSTQPKPPPKRIPIPPTVSHFVMNLPASATDFLGNYQGLYFGREELFKPHTATELPLIHVHCFAVKSEDGRATEEICDTIEKQLGIRLVPGDMHVEGQVFIHNVRDVAPAKSMFCASFRLPRKVAFAKVEGA